MQILSVTNLVRQFDREPVLNGITFDLQQGERAGLVGPNGAGKTTLLKILTGQEHADEGQVALGSGVTVSLLEQQPDFTPGRTLKEEAAQGLEEILQLQHEAAELADRLSQERAPEQQARLAKRYDAVQHELQHRDGFQIDHRIDEVLAGLGFERSQYDQPLATLSGGQQNRVLLGRLLLRSPDLMLLDEPTNHLDIAATEWLERYLIDSGRTLLLVSHDRFFLDRVCTRVLELHAGRMSDYPGNFTQYWLLREERQLVAQRAFEKQQEFIARTEDYIRRNSYGQNATRAKDREHKLARLEKIELVSDIRGPAMGFAAPTRTGDWVVDAVELSKTFVREVGGREAGGQRPEVACRAASLPTPTSDLRPPTSPPRPLFSGLSLRIQRGERWGLLGPNGCGKTTLLRILLGEIPPDSGTVRLGTHVKVGYFDQQLQSVDPNCTAIDAIRPPDLARFTDGQLRDILARFGVIGELALQRVSDMSGGERSKVALARLYSIEPNVLVLDEPTNHLDLWSRDALERSLRDFTGTVLFVSHDRYFLDRVATHLLVYEQSRWWEFPGNYTAWRAFLANREEAKAAASTSTKSAAATSTKEPRRKRKFPYRKAAEIEAEIAAKEELVRQRQVDLADPEVHRDHERLKTVMAEYEATQNELATLYEHWEEAVEMN